MRYRRRRCSGGCKVIRADGALPRPHLHTYFVVRDVEYRIPEYMFRCTTASIQLPVGISGLHQSSL